MEKNILASADCVKFLSLELGFYSFFLLNNLVITFLFLLCWHKLVR